MCAVPRNQRLRVVVAKGGRHLELTLASEGQYPAQIANQFDDGTLRSRSDVFAFGHVLASIDLYQKRAAKSWFNWV